MGVDVVLMRVTRKGTSSKGRRLSQFAVVGDARDRAATIFRNSGKPMLARVDPYGDLILSSAEMEQFIAEAASLIAGANEADAAHLGQILELARRCRDDSGTELHFQGD
jgi:hypothetical protein